MNVIRLPAVLQEDLRLVEFNQQLRQQIARLDWSEVRIAPRAALRRLLAGIDLVEHEGVLGMDTIPEGLQDTVADVCGESPVAALHTRGATAAQSAPEAARPEVWQPTEAPRSEKSTANPEPPPENEPLLRAPSTAELRDKLHELILADLLGPANGADEEVDEPSVRRRYLVGMLGPRRQRAQPEEPGDGAKPEEQDELGVAEATGPEDGPIEPTVPPLGSVFPSSFGITFRVAGRTRALRVIARWGRYLKAPSEMFRTRDGAPKRVWKRTQVDQRSEPIPLVEGPMEWKPSSEQPEVVVRGRMRKRDGDWIVTLFLVNDQEEPEKNRDVAWLFQPELIVEAPDGAPVFRQRPQLRDPKRYDKATYEEEHTLDMLYRHCVEFAIGHGVGAHADTAPHDSRLAVRVGTRVVPTHEVPQQTAPDPAEIPSLAGLDLDMKSLAELPRDALTARLTALADAYAQWIDTQQALLENPAAGLELYEDAANPALDRCRSALTRIREGIELLARDERAATSFQFANRAMWLQRVRTLYGEAVRRGEAADLTKIDVAKNRSWRMFQLAFILLNLPSVTDLGHPDRAGENDAAVADLLWFPTGGGKTEAYLGLTAYTLGLRRLQGTVGGRSGEYGVAVLMRYTLRLLTLQQFQRATALICACEVLRRDAVAGGDTRWGNEPFRIGLWVGQKTTPNRTEQSDEWLKNAHGVTVRGSTAAGVGSPAQLTNCPWCGTRIDPGRNVRVETVTRGSGRTLVFCGDTTGQCVFTERKSPGEGLPVVVVDEEIYRRLPSLVISTIDKFAQLPWNGVTQMLFGHVSGRCTRHGFRSPDLEDSDTHPRAGALPEARTLPASPLRPPDLIIQDELHLISGPLGTLAALYETAIDQLCSWEVDGKKVRPKVIASTATIRRAGDQVHALFLRRVAVFPPHGVDVRDNFFARQRDPGPDFPGRRYIGICAPGRRAKAVLIRVYVAYLGASQWLFERYGRAVDPWMTLVGYFNTVRELAGMRRLVDDDIRNRLRDLERRGLGRRHAPIVEELTSRKSSSDIPVLLDRMEVGFDPNEQRKRKDKTRERKGSGSPLPLDVLLATNMISVGVDVKRLGLMVVGGQPKTTAEYIQATSRVGRNVPGLVCTVYNWARPRDLSHYEAFEHYHATFYQHVEALSVTPFAARALDRGLTALLVALARLRGSDLNANDRADAITRGHAGVAAAIEDIARRAEAVQGSKEAGDEVRKRLKGVVDLWCAEAERAGLGSRLGYREKKDGKTRGLLKPAGLGPWEPFTVLNSLRDVEPTVGLILDDGGLDAPPPPRDSNPDASSSNPVTEAP